MTIDPDGFPAPPALVEHARRFHAEGGTPAVPRVAATVLLLRPATPGFEVYLIRRVAAMAFGGMYAFPGGGVDPSDSAAHVGWAGPTPAEWGVRLGLAPEAAQAVVCAAAREVFEEAGVLLAGPDAGTVVGDVSGDDWEAARVALERRDVGFADLLADRGLTLRSDLLLPWSRWITPEFEPRRFDTYFFVALLPAGQRTRDVSGEADRTLWIRPADAGARAGAGELTMLPPTLVTLGQVAACGDLDAVAAASATRDPATPVAPHLDLRPDGEARFVLG
ncbi:NUDIX hydrolase [Micromonospora thermarum]|uniref:NUDIX domain-containing protein n=1 Tax=Micromonospora thermarum TaxID=2720024 RepID=A0ABX0Z151_9ACTN|nr:NUDIX domain-containing protein [Micromonospora thermarum]NJP31502.1 NUDIX domain-containing protein [Micromonospora thermarum]